MRRAGTSNVTSSSDEEHPGGWGGVAVNGDTLLDGERWYVVHTLAHREGQAQLQLRAQDFRTFLPRHRKTVRHARKLMTVDAPFFPRYAFVALDLTRDRWRSVNGTFGVASLVMAEDTPLPVPPGIVEALIAASDANGHLQFGKGFEVGQAVRVLAGPFASQVGEIARIEAGRRVQVLLRLLGGTVPVRMSVDALIPAQAA